MPMAQTRRKIRMANMSKVSSIGDTPERPYRKPIHGDIGFLKTADPTEVSSAGAS